MRTAALSIVVPVHDDKDRVASTLLRIAAQTRTDFECIVVDDASSDGTSDAVARVIQGDDRFVLSQLSVQSGPGLARNAGLRQARADWVWFVDSDDEPSERFVEVMLDRALAEDGVDLVLCRARERRGDRHLQLPLPRRSRLSRQELLTELLRDNVRGYVWNRIFRRAVLGPDPFPALSSKQDIVAMVQIAPRCRCAVVVDKQLYTYVRREGSVTSSAGNRAVNALVPGRLVLAPTWAGTASTDRSDRSYFGLDGALSYAHDAARSVDAGTADGLREARGRVTPAALAAALRGRQGRAVVKGLAFGAAPRAYVGLLRRMGRRS